MLLDTLAATASFTEVNVRTPNENDVDGGRGTWGGYIKPAAQASTKTFMNNVRIPPQPGVRARRPNPFPG